MAVYQAGDDGLALGIDNFGVRADGIFRVFTHISDPFVFNADGKVLQKLSSVHIDHSGVHNG